MDDGKVEATENIASTKVYVTKPEPLLRGDDPGVPNSEPMTYKDIDKSAVVGKTRGIAGDTYFPPPRDFQKHPIQEGELTKVPGGFAFNDKITEEASQFLTRKRVQFKGGPLDGMFDSEIVYCDENALVYFFRNNGFGEIEQAVYRIVLVERAKPALRYNADDDEKRAQAAIPRVWDWVGEFEGPRRVVKKQVSGVKKGPSAAAAATGWVG